MTASPGVLVFTRHPDLLVFPTLEQAAGYMEAIDVEDGEYLAAYLPDGTLVDVIAPDGESVSLVVGLTLDAVGLKEHLVNYCQRVGLPQELADDPVAMANEILKKDWDAAWPHRPEWLHRWIHGDVPPAV